MGALVDIGDTRLFVEERGEGPPMLVLHGGPGADHTQLLAPLTPLSDEFTLHFVDQRSQGRSDDAPRETWTIEQAARDVSALASALKLTHYAVLGHSYGALVALRHLLDYPGRTAASILSHGVPSVRWYRLNDELESFEPKHLREKVRAAWRKLETTEDPQRASELVARR